MWQCLGDLMLAGQTCEDLLNIEHKRGSELLSSINIGVLLQLSSVTPLEEWDGRFQNLFGSNLGVPWRSWLQNLYSEPGRLTLFCDSLDGSGRDTLLWTIGHDLGESPEALVIIVVEDVLEDARTWSKLHISVVRQFDSDTLTDGQASALSHLINSALSWAVAFCASRWS